MKSWAESLLELMANGSLLQQKDECDDVEDCGKIRPEQNTKIIL